MRYCHLIYSLDFNVGWNITFYTSFPHSFEEVNMSNLDSLGIVFLSFSAFFSLDLSLGSDYETNSKFSITLVAILIIWMISKFNSTILSYLFRFYCHGAHTIIYALCLYSLPINKDSMCSTYSWQSFLDWFFFLLFNKWTLMHLVSDISYHQKLKIY